MTNTQVKHFREDHPLALDKVSFVAKPGEKVHVVEQCVYVYYMYTVVCDVISDRSRGAYRGWEVKSASGSVQNGRD